MATSTFTVKIKIKYPFLCGLLAYVGLDYLAKKRIVIEGIENGK